MATVCPPSEACRQVDVGGRRYTVARDGKFHGVPDSHAKAMVANGECFLPTMTLRGTGKPGWVCDDCGFVAMIRDHCGKCGGTSLTREG